MYWFKEIVYKKLHLLQFQTAHCTKISTSAHNAKMGIK